MLTYIMIELFLIPFKFIKFFTVFPMLQPVISLKDSIPRLLFFIGIIFQISQIAHVREEFPILTVSKPSR